MTRQSDNDDEFDTGMRHLLRRLPVPEDDYVNLPRRSFLQLGAVAMGLTALGASGWYTQQYLSAPPFVRHAFAHVEEESGLRGVLVPDLQRVKATIGKPLPGVMQLCKDCVVDGYRAWHLVNFLDNLGYVSVLVFRGSAPSLSGSGHWLRGYWQFLAAEQNRRMLVLSPERQALNAVVKELQA
ncbi:MAG: hypothetical protein GC149_07780 [Gammaproteobacteria bacterium]|nr:hypothetical protein [Gammaproteobacteria bacterium]